MHSASHSAAAAGAGTPSARKADRRRHAGFIDLACGSENAAEELRRRALAGGGAAFSFAIPQSGIAFFPALSAEEVLEEPLG
jgi:hypothetical protein